MANEQELRIKALAEAIGADIKTLNELLAEKLTSDGVITEIDGRVIISQSRLGKYTLLQSMYTPDMVSGDYAEFILGRNESTKNRGTIYFYYDDNASNDNALGFGFRGNTPTFLTKASGDNVAQRDLEVGRDLYVGDDLIVQDRINASNLQTFEDDAAASGLGSGDIYKTSTGELRIKL